MKGELVHGETGPTILASPMHSIRTIVTVALVGLAILQGHCAQAEAVVLAADVASWRIVLPSDASASERYAAEELQRLLAASTGQTPPLAGKDRGRRGVIFVGAGEALQRRYPDWTAESHGAEGFRIVLGADHLVIAGGRPRGTLYGVYEFAERFLGVRFLTTEHTHIPEDAARALPHTDFDYAPSFAFRWAYWYEANADAAFAARLRNNAITHADHLGGATEQPLISHSLQDQVPVERYGVDHPEYFALVDGVRSLRAHHAPQVDPFHPAVREIVVEAVRAELRAHPQRRVVSVSPADNGEYDEGPTSLRLIEREGTPMAPHLMLVNEVARSIAPEHPGVRVGTLAYWSTRRPPAHLRPLPNVQIQLASFECSLVHALDEPDSPANAAFMRDLDGWLALTPDVYLWHYAANLRQVDLPINNLQALAPTFRMLRDRGVKGVFAQGNGRCPGGELSDLKTYVVSRLLWNPDSNAEELVEEFVELHYGPSAPFIHAALDVVAEAHRAQGGEPTCYPLAQQLGWTHAVAHAFAAHLDAARKAADTPVLSERVDKLRISGFKALIVTAGALRHDAERGYLDFPAEIDAWLGEYRALTTRFGMDRNMEFEPLSHYLAQLERMRAGQPVELLENAHWLVVALPSQGAVIRLRHKASGKELLPAYGSGEVRVLHGMHTAHGLTGFDGPGVPMSIERTPQGLRMGHTDASGLQLTWDLTLEAHPPHRLLGETTVINPTGQTRPARMEVALATGWPGDAPPAFEVLDLDWESVDLETFPWDASPRARGGEVRLGPAPDGTVLHAVVGPGQATPSLGWWPGVEEATMGFRSQRVPLAPGGRFTLRYAIGVEP